jgi:hypothetical protein
VNGDVEQAGARDIAADRDGSQFVESVRS